MRVCGARSVCVCCLRAMLSVGSPVPRGGADPSVLAENPECVVLASFLGVAAYRKLPPTMPQRDPLAPHSPATIFNTFHDASYARKPAPLAGNARMRHGMMPRQKPMNPSVRQICVASGQSASPV